jgi:two-component system, sensor histidine kinase and response regulator
MAQADLVMDGLEAIVEIRDREARRGRGARTPVVAMTAHAMKEDRQRCLSAGMDGHLSKPVTKCDLHTVLARYPVASPPSATVTAPPLGETGTTEWIDRLRIAFRDDPAFVAELLGTAVVESDRGMARLEAALRSEDLSQVAREAHSLKGLYLTIGAGDLAALTASLEADAKGRDLTATQAAHERFLTLWTSFRAALASHLSLGS